MAFHLSQGDEVEVRPTDKIGWVTAVVSYHDSKGTGFIVDTKNHGRFSFSDTDHPDIRKKTK
jgi:hypothetical protein